MPDKPLRERITDYILKWEVLGFRKEELELFHEALAELNDTLEHARRQTHRAAVWQQKFTQCKAEVTILRQRKNHYKRIVMSG